MNFFFHYDIENNEWFPFEGCVRKLININDNGMWTNMFLDNDDNFTIIVGRWKFKSL
jgi:hypothetical protein